MKTKEITICGKQVILAYCFATELAFKNFTGLEIEDFNPSNRNHITYMILSSIASYYQSQETEDNKKAPIKDTDLMYEAKPKEIIDALTEIINLKNEWYGIPKGETIEKETAGVEEEKNV